MNTVCRFRMKVAAFLFVLCTLSAVMARSLEKGQEARQILAATDVRGGLIIHISCGDGQLTAALAAFFWGQFIRPFIELVVQQNRKSSL